MADRFYTPEPLGPGEFVLAGADAHHLAVVRRFAPGDAVTLFNGDGHDYPATVVSAGKKSVVLSVAAGVAADRELPFPLVVAAALPKADRADFLVEKLTELGVSEFVPLVTARSVVLAKGAKVEKLERAVIEASKQCGRNRLMRVRPPTAWADLLASPDLPPVRVVLHPPPDGERSVALSRLSGSAGVAVAVGPEGGFTPDELAAADAAGWGRAALGPRVLRVETAAVAAAAILGERGA
jgi:16S rRNA (uracil1498-N3)-methyltransferase